MSGAIGYVGPEPKMPQAINSFLEDFSNLGVRIQKARLQEILKAAYTYRDNRLELEFRS